MGETKFTGLVGRHNVGRIAERIVANELEFRGFRVSDLNRDGASANADLLAAYGDATIQIQVRGTANSEEWCWQYGYCSEAIIEGSEPMFNRHKSYFAADVVVLVGVRSPGEYSCIVLPAAIAEQAAQMNLDYAFRGPRKNGKPKQPNKVWVPDWSPQKPNAWLEKEQELLKPYRDNWESLRLIDLNPRRGRSLGTFRSETVSI